MWLLLLAVLNLCVVESLHIEEALNDVPGLRYMGTKTPYIFSKDRVKSARSCRNPDTPALIENFFKNKEWKKFCKPVHASLVVRHGNRLPSLKNMQQIEEFVDSIRDLYHVYNIRPEIHDVKGSVFKMIRDWKLPYQYSQEKNLNEWGFREMYEIAGRFAQNYNELFEQGNFYNEEENSHKYHKKSEILEDMLVISSNKSRSVNSAKEFLRGLKYTVKNPFLTDAAIEYSDQLMRFHSTCTHFMKLWDEGKLKQELQTFMESDEIVEIGKKVAKKLGLLEQLTTHGQALHKDRAGKFVWSILNSCYAETAHSGDISPWCQLLDEEDFQKLDFSNDLKHYYKNTGYVESVGSSQSCPLLQHIFQFLDKTVVAHRLRKPYKKLVLRFGHAETLIPLYSLLGLYREETPLTADYSKHRDRVFNLRLIAPHAANLQIILYRCSHTDDNSLISAFLDQYMVEVLVNEVPELLPPCEHVLCPYKQVKEFYRQQTEFCDYDKVCDYKHKLELRDEL